MISLKHKVKKADSIIDNDVSSLHLSTRIVQCLQVLVDLPVDVQASLEFIRSGVISGAANRFNRLVLPRGSCWNCRYLLAAAGGLAFLSEWHGLPCGHLAPRTLISS